MLSICFIIKNYKKIPGNVSLSIEKEERKRGSKEKILPIQLFFYYIIITNIPNKKTKISHLNYFSLFINC